MNNKSKLSNNNHREPLFIESLSKEEFDKELDKGLKDIEEGRTFSLEEVEILLKELMHRKRP